MSTLKYAFKKEWYNIILLALPFIAIPFVWDLLPDQIPTHWNLKGEVDDYSSKSFGLLFIPILNIGLYLIFLYLPKIDPKKRIEIDQKPIPVFRTMIILFLLFTQSWMIINGTGTEMKSQSWIYLALAVFFLVVGNYFKTIKPNYFIGIRVPWALEDEENWRKTHKIGSYIWVAGGLFLILTFPFVQFATFSWLFGFTTLALVLIPTVYSFYIYKTKSEFES